MTFPIRILLGSFSFFILFASSFAQDRKEIESIRFEIIKEIDDTNLLLKETSLNKKTLLSDLNILERQINNRKKLLDQIQKEIKLIDSSIEVISKEKLQSEVRIDSLKIQYRLVLQAMYRDRMMKDPIVAVLSSESLGTSFLKTNYYNRLKQFVIHKMDDINVQKDKLIVGIERLNTEKASKTEILKEVENQSQLLTNEQDKQKVMIASLKEDETALKEALKNQKIDRERMNVAIENIINSSFDLDAKKIVSIDEKNFQNLKGKLMWPVSGGIISIPYGKQKHPTIKNLFISNNGIDIRAPRKSEVHLVTSGKVVAVTDMAGYGKMIIMDHNEYYTVYSKLSIVNVVQGEDLEKGHLLGILDEKNNLSELHFEIWNNNKTLNPEIWLQ